MKHFFSLKFLFVLGAVLLFAGIIYYYKPPEKPASPVRFYPKHEMRAAWIATYKCIDWPSKPGLSTEEQQRQLAQIMRLHRKNGMNAVIMQVRPSGDAIYPSALEPWSQWLSGRQGQAPTPYYDPLEYAIEQAHKRNLEFHAWFNPFRAVVDTIFALPDSSHLSLQHPEWCIAYGKHLYYNPGIPQVRDFVIKVVMDVVRRYAIDAVHFDDYFYPYPIDTLVFEDDLTFEKYGQGFASKADWRRHNINELIRRLSDSIKAAKPTVRFGISPMGVWRNNDRDPLGSATQAASSYDDLYADIVKWLDNKWIDYVVPQLYWHIGHKRADYATLLEWWSGVASGRHLYIGQAVFNLNEEAYYKEWRSLDEMQKQLAMSRENPAVSGNVFFSSQTFRKNPMQISEYLQQNFYRYPALVPSMPWIDSVPPQPPVNLRAEHPNRGILLRWDAPPQLPSPAVYYVVYRFRGRSAGALSPQHIITITRKPQVLMHRRWAFFRKDFTFVVTAVNRNHNESEASQPIILKMKN